MIARQASAIAWVFFVLGLMQLAPAQAIDLARTTPPAAVTDSAVSIGSRSVRLGEGPWTLVSYSKGRYTSTSAADTPVHAGYMAQVVDGRFRAGVVLELGEFPLSTSQWSNDPCAITGNIHKSTLKSTVMFPECLVINTWPGLHKGATNAFYGPVAAWLQRENIDQSITVHDVSFLHFGGSGQGRVRVFVPAARFATPQSLIEWAEKLPDEFRPMMQGRKTEAQLPALP